jgi:hypothetical protein
MQGTGGWYKSPMIRNTADEVREVCPKFDRRCSKLIAKDCDRWGGFDDLCMAQELIELRIWTCRRYREVVWGCSMKIEVDGSARELLRAQYCVIFLENVINAVRSQSKSIRWLYRPIICNAKSAGECPGYYLWCGLISSVLHECCLL